MSAARVCRELTGRETSHLQPWKGIYGCPPRGALSSSCRSVPSRPPHPPPAECWQGAVCCRTLQGGWPLDTSFQIGMDRLHLAKLSLSCDACQVRACRQRGRQSQALLHRFWRPQTGLQGRSNMRMGSQLTCSGRCAAC